MTDDNDVCYCGHVRDEHGVNKFGQPSECEVEGCNCIQYEWDPSTEDEDV